MKTVILILAACVIAIVAGGGLSFLGFQASSATVTVTSTQTFPTATTMTSGSITTTTATTEASLQNDVLDHTYNLDAPGTQYCGIYDETHTTIDPGTLSISFTVNGNDGVDFWMMSSQQWNSWPSSCKADEAYQGMASRIGVTHWDTTVNVPSTGVYYFVFLNENNHAVSISLSVTRTYVALTTEALFLTSYTTESSTWQTSALAVNQQQAGYGPIFFIGVIILIAGAAGFFFYYSRSREGGGGGEIRTFGGEPAKQVTIEVPPPEATQIATPAPPKRGGRRGARKKEPNIFCPQCGTELPPDSTFCKACGNKIESDE